MPKHAYDASVYLGVEPFAELPWVYAMSGWISKSTAHRMLGLEPGGVVELEKGEDLECLSWDDIYQRDAVPVSGPRCAYCGSLWFPNRFHQGCCDSCGGPR